MNSRVKAAYGAARAVGGQRAATQAPSRSELLIFKPASVATAVKIADKCGVASPTVFMPELVEDPRQDERAAVMNFVTAWADLDDWLTGVIVHSPVPARPRIIARDGEADRPKLESMVAGADIRRQVLDKTMREKGGLFLSHLTDNLPSLLDTPFLTSLRNRMSGQPGYIVGSGPSLAGNGRLLAELRGRGIILAAASAAAPLNDMGVQPDAVVVIEAEDTTHFFKDLEFGLLAAASASHPDHFRSGRSPLASFHLTRGAAHICGPGDDFVPQAGQAGTAAFTLGLLLGLNPLVLVGHDQAFLDNQLHSAGTPDAASGEDCPDSYRVAGDQGGMVATHSGFVSSIHWYAESIRYLSRSRPKLAVVNATEGGARIPGVPSRTLADVLDKLKTAPADRPKPRDLIGEAARPDAEAVRAGLRQTWEVVSAVSELTRLDASKAWDAVEDCRTASPFLKEALHDLQPDSSVEMAVKKITEVEGLLLNMIGQVGGL